MNKPIAAETREKILMLLGDILKVYMEQSYDDLPGLLFGNSGITLFLAYYSKHIKQDDIIDNRIEELIYKICAQCNAYPVPSFFGTGIAGIGWHFKQLIQIGLLDSEHTSLVDNMSTHIAPDIEELLDTCNLDALYGFAGHYLFLSVHNRIDKKTQEKIDQFFTSDNLFKRIQISSIANNNDGKINLGLAHGLASVGLLLTVKTQLPDHALKEIVELYTAIAQQVKQAGNKAYPSIFPNSIRTEALASVSYAGSRYAWCYGDLGILYFFAKLNKRYKYAEIDKVLHQLVATSNKRNIENAAVAYIAEIGCYDIGFCHGLSGIFYLQYKINRLLPEKLHLQTNEYWLQLLLTHLENSLCNNSYLARDVDKKYDSLSLLEGLSGAGLALISYLTGDTSWDSCLMLDD